MNQKEEIRKELNEYLDKYIPRNEIDIYKYVVDFIKKDRNKQLILNGVSKRFFVVNELNIQDLEIISNEFTDIKDARGFIETMKNGHTYKNSNLKVINVF